MANNRMYLRCRSCGEACFLGKTFSEGYYLREYDGTPTIDKLNNFYTEHSICGWQPKENAKPDMCLEPRFVKPKTEINPDNQFEIAYERWFGDISDYEKEAEDERE